MCHRLETFEAQHDTEVDIVEGVHAPGLPAPTLEDDEKARGKDVMPAPRKVNTPAKKTLPKKLPACVPSGGSTSARSPTGSKSPNPKQKVASSMKHMV